MTQTRSGIGDVRELQEGLSALQAQMANFHESIR